MVERTKHSTVAYLRVSTLEQDTDKNRAAVLAYANNKDFGKVAFVEEKVSGMKPWRKRKLADVVEDLKAGDRLIVPELSRLGRSLVEVLEVLNVLTAKDAAVYSVKEGFQLNGSYMQSKVMRTMLVLFAEIEHDLIVARTKEGLAAARAKGSLLGRPKGPGKSKLDPYKEEIVALLKTGSRKSYIAKRCHRTEANLLHWLKKRGLHDIAEEY
jgi:DNA invertase Pin-like site-specific DNA recombinase